MIESEAGLVERLRELFQTSFAQGVEVGIGDDAAVISASNNKLVATLDIAIEDVHFKSLWSSPFEIGAKLTTANLADLFSMGATPKYLLVGAAISEINNSEVITELAQGIRSVADKFEVSVIGGDLSKSEKMSLSITALGEIARDPITRSGASAGDLIYLSALPGLSAAGLAILERGLDRPKYVVQAHLNPKLVAPIKLMEVASAMSDISDGLVSDARNIARASKVDLNFDTNAFEASPDFKDLGELATELGVDVYDWILSGGEDHFFIATVPEKYADKNLGIQVGKVVAGSGLITIDGVQTQRAGYQHF
ncbi:MAG: thiamine-monophosphate kinase [Actinomycetota bacterium]